MKTAFQKTLVLSSVVVGSLLVSGSALSQQRTGAGSTNSMYSNQYQADQQRYANQYRPPAYVAPPTHRPSVESNGSQFIWSPEMGNWVPTRMSPQAAQRIGDFAAKKVPACVSGGVVGGGTAFYHGGPKAVPKGVFTGCAANVITN